MEQNELKRAKRVLRSQMRRKLEELPEHYFTERDAELYTRVMEHERVQKAKTILSYWSMPREAHTHSFNETLSKSKRVLLPVIAGEVLEIKVFQGEENMKPEPRFGILEPQGPVYRAYNEIDLVLVPGLAFSTDGMRCGHGKGYYDQLLPQLSHAHSIGLAYQAQCLPTVPIGKHDVVLNEMLFV